MSSCGPRRNAWKAAFFPFQIVPTAVALIEYEEPFSPAMERARMTSGSEAAILSRIIEPNQPELPAPVARIILQWEFSDADRRRMHELLERAKAGKLTRARKNGCR